MVSTTGNTFTTTLTNLTPNSTYHVRAIARNIFDTGSSNEITVETLPLVMPPPNFTATAIGDRVDLSWTTPINHSGTAIIRYDISRDGGLSWVPMPPGSTSRTFNNLPLGLHEFRIRAVTELGAGAYASASATVVGGIAVTVRDDRGQLLQGALVHVMRGGNSNAPHNHTNRLEVARRTDSNGVAFFTNADIGYVGRYGINVTHPDFVSGAHTSTPPDTGNSGLPGFVRTNANQIDPAAFRFTERSEFLRGLGWGNFLEGMGALGWRTNSLFGWREMPGFAWHTGLDFNLPGNDSDGRNLSRNHRIYSAFTGNVISSGSHPSSMGYFATIQFEDRDGGYNYYVRYMHMIASPLVRGGARVLGGRTLPYGYTPTHIGNVGNTGSSQNYHLHLDVHRVPHDPDNPNASGFAGSDRSQQLDPHAFFQPGFVNPRPQIAGY